MVPGAECLRACEQTGDLQEFVVLAATGAGLVLTGTVIGLRGPSGSGKSTLLNVIGCILEPNSGTMTLNGELVY